MARTIMVDSTSVDRLLAMVKFAASPPMMAVFLSQRVHPYLVDEIEDRFTQNGDAASGAWPDLSPTSLRVRHDMGQMDDSAINDRTGAMKDYLTSQFAIRNGAVTTEMWLPGEIADSLLETKIDTAQHGATGTFHGHATQTPARPVLALDGADRTVIVGLLQTHVMDVVHGMHAIGGMIP